MMNKGYFEREMIMIIISLIMYLYAAGYIQLSQHSSWNSLYVREARRKSHQVQRPVFPLQNWDQELSNSVWVTYIAQCITVGMSYTLELIFQWSEVRKHVTMYLLPASLHVVKREIDLCPFLWQTIIYRQFICYQKWPRELMDILKENTIWDIMNSQLDTPTILHY